MYAATSPVFSPGNRPHFLSGLTYEEHRAILESLRSSTIEEAVKMLKEKLN
jgi:DNA-binding GntR family transcriptional regulator